MPDVIVVGAGPVGTLLSAELSRLGVSVALLDQRGAPGDGTRAIGVHSPVLAALEASGVTERLLASAVRVRRGQARSDGRTLGVVRFDRLDRRFPFVAALPQAATETALGVGAPPVQRGAVATAVVPQRGAVRVRLSDGEQAAPLVVVAGGWRARPLVYRPGAVHVRPYADRYLMTDAAASVDSGSDARSGFGSDAGVGSDVGSGSDAGSGSGSDAGVGSDVAIVNVDRSGVLESFPLPGGRRRFVAWDEAPGDASGPARVARLRRALEIRGEDPALVVDATPFEVRRAVAPALRRDRLFVIGDTAHEVSPIGGQGMNLGLLDAATLAPLLAAWVRSGSAPEADLARWERRRLASARTAAALATLNTSLGRPLGRVPHAVRRAALRLALLPPGAALLAHAYAMGFDRDA